MKIKTRKLADKFLEVSEGHPQVEILRAIIHLYTYLALQEENAECAHEEAMGLINECFYEALKAMKAGNDES